MEHIIGQLTGFKDGNNVPIEVGDHMIIPSHLDSSCCDHRVRCEIKWNDEWKAYGMQTKDGEWLSGMGFAGGFFVERSLI